MRNTMEAEGENSPKSVSLHTHTERSFAVSHTRDLYQQV